MNTKRRPLADRLWEKIDRRGPDNCWPWTGSLTPNGYGQINASLLQDLQPRTQRCPPASGHCSGQR